MLHSLHAVSLNGKCRGFDDSRANRVLHVGLLPQPAKWNISNKLVPLTGRTKNQHLQCIARSSNFDVACHTACTGAANIRPNDSVPIILGRGEVRSRIDVCQWVPRPAHLVCRLANLEGPPSHQTWFLVSLVSLIIGARSRITTSHRVQIAVPCLINTIVPAVYLRAISTLDMGVQNGSKSSSFGPDGFTPGVQTFIVHAIFTLQQHLKSSECVSLFRTLHL